MQAFNILTNNDHRNARANVVDSYIRYRRGEVDVFDFPCVKEAAARVRRDFNIVGSLILNELAHCTPFMNVYAHTTMIMWKALENNICEERTKRNYPTYLQEFQKLNDEARSYWRLHHHLERVYVDEFLI